VEAAEGSQRRRPSDPQKCSKYTLYCTPCGSVSSGIDSTRSSIAASKALENGRVTSCDDRMIHRANKRALHLVFGGLAPIIHLFFSGQLSTVHLPFSSPSSPFHPIIPPYLAPHGISHWHNSSVSVCLYLSSLQRKSSNRLPFYAVQLPRAAIHQASGARTELLPERQPVHSSLSAPRPSPLLVVVIPVANST
jgi:hypothetical protein